MEGKKRLWVSVILGAVLGIFCIIGIGFRLGYSGNELLLLSAWFNRVVMGLASGIVVVKGRLNPAIRGGLLGLVVSFAWFLSTGFVDTMGFLAGIVYGVIIDYVASR